MAKKVKTLLLRNITCDFVCPWVNKLDGSDNHSFAKGEIFEVPEMVERKRLGKKVMVSSLELLKNAFGAGIEEAKGAISMADMKAKDEEIARLKKELAKKSKNSEKLEDSENSEDSEDNEVEDEDVSDEETSEEIADDSDKEEE